MSTTYHSGSAYQAPTAQPPDAALNHALRTKWRKRLFAFWIAGSAVVAAYLMIGGPLTPFTGLNDPHIALVVVPFMLLMLISGLAWLILLVRSRR
ncbi:hypothetical protein [Pelagibius sp. 7325]|uniref:hypothetical protein n=1 Tax=Pelagibius sp. 7325 TaxID=3131994 RepID=UPI0030EE2918